MSVPSPENIEAALAGLTPVKLALVAGSNHAGANIRDCATCDAHCCRVGFNSMLVSRIEAVAMARRLREPDLAPRLEEIRERARAEIEERGLAEDPFADYDCPLNEPDGKCLIHGPAQPAGCLTFRPVADGGCDHDLDAFETAESRIDDAEAEAFGEVEDPRPIPVALLRALAAGDGPG